MPLDLTNPNNQHLLQSGFDLAEIEKSPTLVNLLNQFKGTLTFSNTVDGARAAGETIEIAIGYKNLLNIAHELAHATGHYQQINSDKNNLYHFDTATDYGMARARAEGEATYHEFMVAKELGYNQFKKTMWLDNEATLSVPDLYSDIDNIMTASPATSQAEKIDALATLNQAMLPSGQLHAPFYTYDEYNHLVFLNNRHLDSKISHDYQQAMGTEFDWNTFEAKSLANRANGHYGTIGDDIITNRHVGGSVLGRQGKGDLLWGNQGNDILVGNSGQDILLGGQGDDILMGNRGNDILAGGFGNDLYYLSAGFGQDTIVNQGGGIDNVYLTNMSFDQLALMSQHQQDLVLNFANTSDQLTLKDFFVGGEQAQLMIHFGLGGWLTSERIFENLQVSAATLTSHATRTDYQLALLHLLNFLQDKHLVLGSSFD